MNIPNQIPCGSSWKNGHVQGIAIDTEKGHVYYCFTTVLVKTDFSGTVLGTVGHLAGHMGCITMDPQRRRLYGSLELKHDMIGRGVIEQNGNWNPSDEDSFYLVAFDIDRIDRPGMNAETDGVMQAVYLSDVVHDYSEPDERCGLEHRYGCSGIDGIGLGPVFGAPADSRQKIMIAYGIYGQPDRTGNDHQVILQFDPDVVDRYGQTLRQETPHHSGPAHSESRFFLYTGNTTFGVQNLEYDPFTRRWLAAVYEGKKAEYPNYPMFFIDGTVPPHEGELFGRNGEHGLLLTLARGSESAGGITGCRFPLGQTGVWARGDGSFWFSTPKHDRGSGLYSATLTGYRFDPSAPDLFVPQ